MMLSLELLYFRFVDACKINDTVRTSDVLLRSFFFVACPILGINLLPNMLVSSLGHQSLTQHGGMSCHVMSCHVMLIHTIFWRGDRFFYCTGASHAVLHHHVSLRNI